MNQGAVKTNKADSSNQSHNSTMLFDKISITKIFESTYFQKSQKFFCDLSES